MSGIIAGCSADLPKEEGQAFIIRGFSEGYSQGYSLMAEGKNKSELFLTPPDQVDDAQKSNPMVNIQDHYIPKGYWTLDDVADSRFPDGTPFNKKQKEQAIRAYNWAYYSGFIKACDDYVEGKSIPLIPRDLRDD